MFIALHCIHLQKSEVPKQNGEGMISYNKDNTDNKNIDLKSLAITENPKMCLENFLHGVE